MTTLIKSTLALVLTLAATHLVATPMYHVLPDGSFDTAVAGLTETSLDLSGTPGAVSSVGLTDGSGRTVGITDENGGSPYLVDGTSITWWPVAENFIGTTTAEIVLDFGRDFYVQAVAFSIGSRWANPRLWFETTLTDGSTERSQNYYPGSSANALASYGVSLANGSDNACRSISSLTIDPDPNWGVSGVKIFENTGCAQVPEPGSLSLLGAGLLGLGLLQRSRRRKALETATPV